MFGRGNDHTRARNTVYVLMGVWLLFLLPSLLFFMLAVNGFAQVAGQELFTQRLLYYNAMAFPFVIVLSLISSYVLLRLRQERLALLASLLPFLNMFLELVAADIVLLLS